MDLKVVIIVLATFLPQSLSFPRDVSDRSSFVVSAANSKHARSIRSAKEGEDDPLDLALTPKIYEMRVDSNVSNRFAQTLVTSKVRNLAQKAQEAVFAVILPEKAFISKFVMSIDGKDYAGYVKEKEQAKQIYDQAVSNGVAAAHVAVSARDSTRFTVSVNVEPSSKATFYLTYEQLLEREDKKYELVINIHPKQPVKNLIVNVNINETSPLKFVNAPAIRSGNDISTPSSDLDPRADIHIINSTSAVVTFNPSIERQKELAANLKENVDEGLSGQFIVQYDVERTNNGGEILLDDGYFVHFFAPLDIPRLPKYVVFVLDTSGSMYGIKMEQLKIAMNKILSELKPDDLFHLVDFNSRVQVLSLENIELNAMYPSTEPGWHANRDLEEDISKTSFPRSNLVNPDNIKKANNIINSIQSGGGTNIGDALKVALHLVNVEKRRTSNGPQPMIIFLTDGEATIGVTDSTKIISKVSEENINSVPIFSLSFGTGADRALLQKLSLRNNGFARHIYEAADASLQLQDFYNYISSPVISNVTFKYISDAKEVTKTKFPILFEGSELVVAGVLDKQFPTLPTVSGWGAHGPIDLVPVVRTPISKLERTWAYLTIQQLLDKREISNNKTEIEKKALNLALKYSFVTPVSSLVVVKPNATHSVEPEAADKNANDRPVALAGALSAGGYNFMMARPMNAHFASPGLQGVHYMARPAPEFASTPSTTLPVFTTSFATTETEETHIEMPTYKPPTAPLRKIHTVEDLKYNLPWLNNTLLQNNVLRTEKGDYPLGIEEKSTDNVTCPASPKNGVGICKLLHECPEVHYLLTNMHIFQQYYCEMKGLAAICCPLPKPPTN